MRKERGEGERKDTVACTNRERGRWKEKIEGRRGGREAGGGKVEEIEERRREK